MTGQWSKQKRELDSYNVFFNSFKGATGDPALYDLGYRLIGTFVEIPDPRNGVNVEPDLVLFNGATLIIVEIKSGENINDRDVRQMREADQLSIEASIDWLNNANIHSEGYDPNGLNNIEPIIVYYKEFIEACRDSSGCSEALNELAPYCTIVSQKKGAKLQIEKGKFDDSELQDFLSDGISIPKLVDKNIYLTENVNREILAYSIVHDAVLNTLGTEDEIVVTSDDIIQRFSHRKIQRGKVNDCLAYLRKIGACVKKSEGYVFRISNISDIMSVGDYLDESTVRDYLSEEEPEEQQKTLMGYSERAESDDDD